MDIFYEVLKKEVVHIEWVKIESKNSFNFDENTKLFPKSRQMLQLFIYNKITKSCFNFSSK